MSTETNTVNGCTPSQTRVLPEWMTTKFSPSKNSSNHLIKKTAEINAEQDTSVGVAEASCKPGDSSALAEEVDVKEDDLNQADNTNSLQSKVHQLSDDEGEERVKDEDVSEEQENVHAEQNEEPGEDDSREEQGRAKQNERAEDDSREEQGGDDEGEADAPGQQSTQSQNSTTSGIQAISWRVLCNYGAKCYRKNPEHKKDYCHPWDDDYDTVFSGLPACPYGARCYRKNKAHWQTHTHPPAARPGKRRRKPTTAQQTVTGSDLDDEYDSADSFLNDASSDDYQPTDSASDSDISDADDDAEDGEPDAKRTKKEAKRFLRKKK